MARSTKTDVSDASGWSITVDSDDTTTAQGGGGTVYALSVVNTSPDDLTLWWVVSGLTQTLLVSAGQTQTQTFPSPTPGQIQAWGVH